MLLMINNCDSLTLNLGEPGQNVRVVRNDELDGD